jgi:hypothetical protein
MAELPSWLFSLVVHLAGLAVLALMTLPLPDLRPFSLVASVDDTDQVELEEVPLDVPLETISVSLVDSPVEVSTDIATEVALDSLTELAPPTDQLMLDDIANMVSTSSDLAYLDALPTGRGMTGSGLEGRSAASRSAMIRRGGGTAASEKSVQAGLRWIADHQLPDGSWNFDHRYGACDGRCGNPGSMLKARSAATGLALLCYLGAGHTHIDGDYESTVHAGIYALASMLKIEKEGGSFWEPEGRMYSHGIATMALCEAYAMTRDEALRAPAQAAINYICNAQDPRGGGWRYAPRQPGDTSVVGWQLAALKSGYLSTLEIPPLVVARASGYLDSVEYDGGAGFSYTADKLAKRPALNAIGPLCRMYLGMKRDNPRLVAGVEGLARSGPSNNNCYYNYYASQVMFHYTGGKGEQWKKWNEKLRDMLVQSQATGGHEKGSWAPFPDGDHGTQGGGRLYATALSTMTLEVYYRMMPLYSTDAVEKDFAQE